MRQRVLRPNNSRYLLLIILLFLEKPMFCLVEMRKPFEDLGVTCPLHSKESFKECCKDDRRVGCSDPLESSLWTTGALVGCYNLAIISLLKLVNW